MCLLHKVEEITVFSSLFCCCCCCCVCVCVCVCVWERERERERERLKYTEIHLQRKIIIISTQAALHGDINSPPSLIPLKMLLCSNILPSSAPASMTDLETLLAIVSWENIFSGDSGPSQLQSQAGTSQSQTRTNAWTSWERNPTPPLLMTVQSEHWFIEQSTLILHHN